MVYIYKKIVGSKPYYYLRASERKGSRIIAKDIVYLGSSLEEVKNKLDSLPKYSVQIRKAYKTIHNFLESNHYVEKVKELKLKKDIFLDEDLIDVEAARMHYNTVFLKNNELTKEEIIKNFIVEFTFNTTSIEGNTIKLEEARNLLEEGIAPKGKTLREIYDIQNTEKVFLKVFNNISNDINHDFIIDIHKKLMENIDVRIGYRLSDVRVINSNFDATPAPYVKSDMDLLIRWYNENENKLHPLVLAIIFHHKFEKIHPFMDGNGRTGRMLFNSILLRSGFSPCIIHKKTRAKYLKALREADKSNLIELKKEHYRNLIKFVANEFVETYWNIFL